MRREYDNYSTEEFLDDPFFISWVKNGSSDADIFWKEWSAGKPDNLKAFQEARMQLSTILSATPILPAAGDEDTVWQQIQHSIDNKGKVRSIRQFKYWSIAAAAV